MKTTEQLKAGMRVKVDAHGQHEEDFSGIIERVDNDNYLVHVRAPDGELYGCTMAFVREWPEDQAGELAQHTPGTWVVEIEDGKLYIESEFGTLARVAPCGDSYDAEDEANANLIAASPELLEIVKQFESHVVCLNEMYGDQAPMSAGIVELALKARVAIAKAKGGAS